ncbi:MAG: CotJB protein [Haloplasmataceae bacterium]|jgi:spore coat protein JB|nr:CotJB protein [Haloplasmataceae bacterium]
MVDTTINRQELLLKIQELDFFAVELNLFLDTHPTDVQALNDFKYIIETVGQYKKLYENTYGPLLNFGDACVTGNTWSWIAVDYKWPWENV